MNKVTGLSQWEFKNIYKKNLEVRKLIIILWRICFLIKEKISC